MRNLLYIGLNGYAGSGKDTVAKILKVILNNKNESLEKCKEIFNRFYKNPMISATYGGSDYGTEYDYNGIIIYSGKYEYKHNRQNCC